MGVRDVADLHLRAMIDAKAAGERFIATGGDRLWMIEVANILRRRMGDAAKEVPTREQPNWVVRLVRRRKEHAALALESGERGVG